MFDRKSFKKGLGERIQESYSSKDSSGRFRSIFIDDNLKRWNPDNGEHEFNIIPYLVGENDPRVHEGKLKVGAAAYVLDIWVHRGIGVTEDSYVCLARNYKRPCPICEEVKRLKGSEDFDEDIVKNMDAKRRVIYNVWVVDNPKEEKKGVQIFEVAHWFMEAHLMGISKKPREGGYIDFVDPDDGKIIFFEKSGSKASTKYDRHQFVERKEPLSDEILKEAKCLDGLVHIPTYEELKVALRGGMDEVMSEDDPDNYEEKPSFDLSKEKIFTEKDDEEEQEEKKEDGRKKRCYEGGVFGKDYMKFEACADCGSYRLCEFESKKTRPNAPASGSRRSR